MSKHSEKSALKSLAQKEVVQNGKILTIKRNSLGNGSLGKLSFLRKKCGYIINWTTI